LRECGQKKVKTAIIISSGFSEAGNRELEEEVITIAKTYGISLLGPNCLGVINPSQKLNASFFNKLPAEGDITFISQSGALGVAMLDWAIQNKIGLRAFVSVGNASMIDFYQLLEYFGADPKTKAICIYAENIKHGQDFVRRAEQIKKPVIVLKAGITEAGAKAALSHTAALASEDAIYEGAFKQFGVMRVNNLHQLFEVAKHISHEKSPKGRKGLVITNAGGAGVLASDAFEKNKLTLVEIPKNILESLNKVLPAHWSHGNPVDIIGDARPERYKAALDKIAKERFYDFVLLILTPQTMSRPDEVAKILVEFHKKTKTPCFGCFMGGDAIRGAKKILKDNFIVNFKEPEYGAELISKMVRK
jgi:acetyltransferase